MVMENRFCSLAEEDMDIPSPWELIVPGEVGCQVGVTKDSMDIGNRGKRDQLENEDAFSFDQSMSSSSSFTPVKSKSQIKHERKMKLAIAKAKQKLHAQRVALADPT